MSLWSSEHCDEWHEAAGSYDQVVAAQQVNGLEDLDRWIREDLPAQIKSRSPAHVTRDDLVRATSWKMKRGVWRERNRLLVAGNEADEVERASAEAFAAVPDPGKPVVILCRLAGAGPATASAVLSAHSPEIYPFFDELVAAQIDNLGPVAFTTSYYSRYAARLRERAGQLSESCSHREWTAQDVSQALWAASGGKAGNEKVRSKNYEL
jgi:hypothetical protein